jgi:TolA-binding protein
MVPGHSITRTAVVFESTPTGGALLDRKTYVKAVPDFVEESLEQAEDPEEEIIGPTVDFSLRDPDSLVSPFARVPVYVGARNTQARRIVGSTAADLEGSVSGAIELAREQEERSLWSEKELSFDDPMFTHEELSSWKTKLQRAGSEQRGELLSGAPLPVLGDDVIFFQYLDRSSSTSDAQVARIPTRHQLMESLEESERTIPGADSDQFLANAPIVRLQDPETRIGEREATIRRRYENLMGRRREMYEKMLTFLTDQHRELSRRLELARARAAEESEKEPAEESPAEAAGPTGDQMLAAETELAQETVLTASEMLQERIKKVESDIEQTRRQVEFYRRFEIPDQAMEPTTAADALESIESEEETGPYFNTPIPGYPFKIHVTDPDLQDRDEISVVIRSYLHGLLTRTEVSARPKNVVDPLTGESRRVFEAVVQTDEKAAEGTLPVGWGGVLHISYADPVQEQPSERLRRSFVSFASDGALGITQRNFVDPPATLRVGEALNAVVKDADRDVSFERDNLLVQASSRTGDTLAVMLSETAGRSGEFRGRIPTAPGEANPNDATLQCGYGGQINVTYRDYINTGDENAPAGLQETPAEEEEESEEGESETQPSCVEVSAGTGERGVRELTAVASLLPGSDGEVKLFARNLKRGRLEKETLFSSGYAHYMLGKNFSELGSFNRADEVFARARDQFMELIRRYPGHEQVAHATFYLGNIQFVQENYQEAIRYYRNVLENAPKSDFIPQTRLRIGMAYEKLDKTQKAMEQYAYLTFHHTDSPYVKDAMVNLVLYFDNKGREADAEGEEEERDKAFARLVSVARRFEEKFPNDERAPRVILRAALRMVSSEKYATAAEILEQAEETHADNTRYMPAFLYWHAEALLKGKVGEEPTERARVLLQRVVYDFEDTRYQRIAKARLVEVED